MQTIHKDFAFVNEAFDGVGDPRCPSRILYSPATLLWTPTLGFMNRCDSRNAMDADRNDEGYALTVAALSAQDWWPEEEARTTPCMGTVCAFLEHVDPARLEAVLTKTVFRLIRRKQLTQKKLAKLIQCALHMLGPPSTGRQFQLRFSSS